MMTTPRTHYGADAPSAPPADYVDRGRRTAIVEATMPAAHREYLVSVSAHGCLGDPHAPGTSPDAPEDVESLLPLPASPCVPPAELLPPTSFGPPPPSFAWRGHQERSEPPSLGRRSRAALVPGR